MSIVEVVEVTDPFCSWAWGMEARKRRLRWRFPDRFDWRIVTGQVLGDQRARYGEKYDPIAYAPRTSTYWSVVTEHTGMPYPKRLQYQASTSRPACIAIKAAGFQGDEIAERVARRLREANFVFGIPADSAFTIERAVRGIAGLDVARLMDDVASPAAVAAFEADWEETRNPNDYVRNLRDDYMGNGSMKTDADRERYAFPTFLFRGPGGEHTVPGWQPYEALEAAMEAALAGSASEPRPDPTPGEALEAFPLLCPPELASLCGPGAVPPADVVEYDWGDGVVWMTEAEAAAWAAAPVPL